MTRSLTDLMHRATDGPEPDLAALAAGARRRGLGIRRRRQALGLVGTAAGVALLLGGVQLVGGVAGDTSTGRAVEGGAAAGSPASPSPSATDRARVGASGPATATILVDALDRVGEGRITAVRGQGAGGGETFAQVEWRPADATGISVVEVNVQPGFQELEVYECASYMEDCRTTTRPDGSRLVTYEEASSSNGVGIRRVVDLLRPDGTRVVASAANGYDLPRNAFDPTRDRPVLSYAQLRQVVEDPAFGDRVDAAYADPARQPAGYVDIDALAEATCVDCESQAPAGSAQPDPQD